MEVVVYMGGKRVYLGQWAVGRSESGIQGRHRGMGVAAALGISPDALSKLVRAGSLPVVRVVEGGRQYFRVDDLRKLRQRPDSPSHSQMNHV